jgi:hypothetical protein
MVAAFIVPPDEHGNFGGTVRIGRVELHGEGEASGRPDYSRWWDMSDIPVGADTRPRARSRTAASRPPQAPGGLGLDRCSGRTRENRAGGRVGNQFRQAATIVAREGRDGAAIGAARPRGWKSARESMTGERRGRPERRLCLLREEKTYFGSDISNTS